MAKIEIPSVKTRENEENELSKLILSQIRENGYSEFYMFGFGEYASECGYSFGKWIEERGYYDFKDFCKNEVRTCYESLYDVIRSFKEKGYSVQFGLKYACYRVITIK